MEKKSLHSILCEILSEIFPEDKPRCYFEPPADLQIQYPCIVYHRINDQNVFADNIRYRNNKRYTVTVIDRDPDSKIPEKVAELSYCTPDRVFSSDSLTHFPFSLFYNGPRINEEEDNESND